ncbi:MAG TPA: hypothetical protein VF628_06945 [Allosphingosinicella sp.]|jgi:hypothetical protein
MAHTSFCSPARPWGIHPSLEANHCPRCGWAAREPAVPDGNPPIPPKPAT